MTLRPRLLLLALTPLLPLPAVALPDTGSPAVSTAATTAETHPLQEQIFSIVDMSGLTGLGLQARNLAQQVLNDTGAPLGKQYEVVDVIAPRWAPGQLQQQLSASLEQYDAGQLQTLLQTFGHQRLLNARAKEQDAIRQQGSAAYQDYIQRLRLQPPPADRLQRIQELDSAMQFSALLEQTRAAVYPQLQAVLREWQPPADWQTQLHSDVTEFLLYVHRSTPNQDLERLTELYRNDALQGWLQTVRTRLGS